ncbi:MAG: hydrogenase expression/formation protein, partial [Arenibacter algicola]|nr:hydrogenase expression/formation protein [Arenibacter algicola]
MNATPVWAEVRDRVIGYVPGAANHVINCTLLPMSEADMALMRETLGAGHIDLVSKGYGKCRVCSTRWPNVWSVQFFNAMDTIILDSLEVGDVPVSVRAAGDDFADSSVRILEIIEAYL